MSVAVVGSANLDIVLRAHRIPRPGETILCDGQMETSGGKGLNQAIAAARAGGARTCFVGAVGDDDAGVSLRTALSDAGVGLRGLVTLAGPSGRAYIVVDDHAENAIVVASGANARLDSLDDAQVAVVKEASVVLCQLEVPQQAILSAAKARGAGARLVLNAAPAAALLPALWEELDVLVVNEHEAIDLAATLGQRGLDLTRALEVLGDRVEEVVVTLGSRGALRRRGGHIDHVPAPEVHAVDTSGAGDTFCGVVAASLARGESLLQGVRWGVGAAALAVTRRGAAAAVPGEHEVRAAAAVGAPRPHPDA